MRIVLGIILILMGVSLLCNPFMAMETSNVNLTKDCLNKHSEDFEGYIKKHPIQNEITRTEYEQERANLKDLMSQFNRERVEKKSGMVQVIGSLYFILGLLYLIVALVFFVKPQWVTSLMAIIFADGIVVMSLIFIQYNAWIDFFFKLENSTLKLEYILGLNKGDYYQMALNFKNGLANQGNLGFTVMAIIYLMVPTIYLIRAFLQEGKKI